MQTWGLRDPARRLWVQPVGGAFRIVLGAGMLLLILSFAFNLAERPAAISMPGLVLWAWERPEDLRFIDTEGTGVAYLAATVELQRDGGAQFHFRQQPLQAAKNTSLMAVVRMESPPRFVWTDPSAIATRLVQISEREGLRGLQIDYDARALERNFYRALLSELRRKSRVPIGITALASWCDGDAWIEGQPFSEAVPMFFRMGLGESKGMPVKASACRDSIGLSTDDAWPASRPQGLRNGARIYVFNPHAWTKQDYDAVVRHVREWK